MLEITGDAKKAVPPAGAGIDPPAARRRTARPGFTRRRGDRPKPNPRWDVHLGYIGDWVGFSQKSFGH